MKRFAHVENGIVATISEAESAEFAFGGIELDPVLHAEIGIGDLYNGSTFSKQAPPPLTPEQIKHALVAAVQGHMDAAARSLGYDDIKSAVTYADEPVVPKFQNEGRAFRAWRSLVWAKCYQVMGEVEAQMRPIPTTVELIAELPSLVLP